MQFKGQKQHAILMLGGLLLIAAVALIFLNQPASAKTSERAFLGVYLGNLDDDLRESLNYKGSGGAFIDDVVDDGPAEEAGIEEGDIVIKFNGMNVEDESQLRQLIHKAKPGDEVSVTVFREGKELEFTVKLGEGDDEFLLSWYDKGKHPKRPMRVMYKTRCSCADRAWLGVEMQKLTEQLGEYFKVKGGEGVLISSVIEDSPAEKAGLKAGDVIVKIDDEEIEDGSDLIEYLGDKEEGDEVTVNVVRKGKTKEIKVTLGECPKERCHHCYGKDYGRHFDKFKVLKDLEICIPDIDREELLKDFEDIHIDLDEPIEELREQMEELRKELDELKEKVK